MVDKLLSPGAFTIAPPKFKEVEDFILKNGIFPLEQAQVLDRKKKLKIHETVRFLTLLELIKQEKSGAYVLNQDIDKEDNDVISFFAGRFKKMTKINYTLLFLYRMKKVFPFLHEVFKVYCKNIWIFQDPQRIYNILADELKEYIEENKHLYNSGEINFKLRHVKSVINALFVYLGILYEIPDQDYYMVKINDSMFEELLFKNKKKGNYSLLGLIKFMEKFIPVVEKEISATEFKLFPLILLKLKNNFDLRINNVSFNYQADSSYINLVDEESQTFISHIQHDEVI